MESVLDILRRTTIFGRLPAEELVRLAAQVRPRKLEPGQLLFREGEACNGFYVVAEGEVRLYKVSPDGRERTLHIVRPPHAFAEAAMFLPAGYPAFAIAQAPSRVLLVPTEVFRAMLVDRPETAVRVFESLSHWLHRLLDQLETETFMNARAKLATYLLREAQRQCPNASPARIELRDPKKTIASQLGMTPETFSRAQTDLEKRGLIAVETRTITIADPDALQAAILTTLEP